MSACTFAEFRSVDGEKKDTAMISTTNDPTRALSQALHMWRGGDSKNRDPSTIFVSVMFPASTRYRGT